MSLLVSIIGKCNMSTVWTMEIVNLKFEGVFVGIDGTPTSRAGCIRMPKRSNTIDPLFARWLKAWPLKIPWIARAYVRINEKRAMTHCGDRWLSIPIEIIPLVSPIISSSNLNFRSSVCSGSVSPFDHEEEEKATRRDTSKTVGELKAWNMEILCDFCDLGEWKGETRATNQFRN